MSADSLVSPAGISELRRLAAAVPAALAIVEIGAWRGGATCAMAAAADAHVWTVDPWELAGNPDRRWAGAAAHRMFDRQVREAGLSRQITALQAFSAQAASTWPGPPVGLLFIDGDHAESAVRADWEAWRPHLADGATVAFDDYRNPDLPGVSVVVDELHRALSCTPAAGRLAVGRYGR